MELKKDIECLSQQMVQVPSEYDLARHFLLVLRKEISSTVVKYGYNPENSDLQTIFEVAKSIEQAHHYEKTSKGHSSLLTKIQRSPA